MALMRCKMRVNEVTRSMGDIGEVEQEKIRLNPCVTKQGDNTDWSKWTPSGVIELTITNPAAFGKVTRGQVLYVDFIPLGE